ncbi:hypothetical protein SLNWT_4651 [Streptomyces albus]|uniref:Uncharacterized protein n=1 Tax=Streptomyces albus (strain ATCC 21838 / DSM 41398 / FERM P-419 / JCM 4703 / NBRC 107858) TaxID=1081613 RepID=A0A0B5F3Z4_STRA4|nr:hypothetical protein SLNWT_4651 [Streptomyces albus]AOU79333.1 hypothetical protein SLNHY_4642 [Streptomyces albus]
MCGGNRTPGAVRELGGGAGAVGGAGVAAVRGGRATGAGRRGVPMMQDGGPCGAARSPREGQWWHFRGGLRARCRGDSCRRRRRRGRPVRTRGNVSSPVATGCRTSSAAVAWGPCGGRWTRRWAARSP